VPARPLYNLCSRRALFSVGVHQSAGGGPALGHGLPGGTVGKRCAAMTKQQRRAVRRGLRQYGDALRSGDKAGTGMEWAGVVAKVMDYYARADPVCGELLRLRYLERWREDKTFPALHIGRTTYYTKELEALSTVGIYAAAAGLLDDVRDFGPGPDNGRRG